MKLSFKTKKLNAVSWTHLGLTLALFAVLIYDALIIKSIYQKLHEEPPYQAVTRIVRINTKELDKATERFNATLNYTPANTAIPDPF